MSNIKLSRFHDIQNLLKAQIKKGPIQITQVKMSRVRLTLPTKTKSETQFGKKKQAS